MFEIAGPGVSSFCSHVTLLSLTLCTNRARSFLWFVSVTPSCCFSSRASSRLSCRTYSFVTANPASSSTDRCVLRVHVHVHVHVGDVLPHVALEEQGVWGLCAQVLRVLWLVSERVRGLGLLGGGLCLHNVGPQIFSCAQAWRGKVFWGIVKNSLTGCCGVFFVKHSEPSVLLRALSVGPERDFA